MKNFIYLIICFVITIPIIYCNSPKTDNDITLNTKTTEKVNATLPTQNVPEPYYTNGPKLRIFRADAVRIEDDKILGSTEIKNGWVEIDIIKKIISIYYAPDYIDKYYYYEYNKDIKAKGRLLDMYSISRTETADGKNDKIEVLVFKKKPNTDYLRSIYMMGEKEAYVLRIIE